MNCKPGDIVQVIRSEFGNEGRIGRVMARATVPAGRLHGVTIYPTDDWLVEGRFQTADENVMSVGGTPVARWVTGHREIAVCPFPDSWLRPLRDSDGRDETLTWAGKPEAVSA